MPGNESHPLFRKDEALIDEFNTWFVRSANDLQSIAKKREMLEYIDNANSMARNVKQQIAQELDKDDTAPGDSGGKERQDIFSRYAAVNDRIWERRGQIGTQLDTMLGRQDIKAERPRDRMPSHIVAAAKTSPDQQKAASAFDHLMEPRQTSPDAALSLQRNQEQERT